MNTMTNIELIKTIRKSIKELNPLTVKDELQVKILKQRLKKAENDLKLQSLKDLF